MRTKTHEQDLQTSDWVHRSGAKTGVSWTLSLIFGIHERYATTVCLSFCLVGCYYHKWAT